MKIKVGDLVVRKKEALANFKYTGLCEVVYISYECELIKVTHDVHGIPGCREPKFFDVVGRRV